MITNFNGPTPKDRFIQKTLAEYSDGDVEFENELIMSYITSVREHLPLLEASLRSRDEKESILHSHDIKGSSSYIGAEAVRFVSGKMEALCKESNLEKAQENFAELREEVEQLFALLESYISKDAAAKDDTSEAASDEPAPSTQHKEIEKLRQPETAQPEDDYQEVTVTIVDPNESSDSAPSKPKDSTTSSRNTDYKSSSNVGSTNINSQSKSEPGYSSSREKMSKEYPGTAPPTDYSSHSNVEKSGTTSCSDKLRETVCVGTGDSVANH